MNIYFALTFDINVDSIGRARYSHPTIKIEYYNMIYAKNFFNQPTKNDMKTYDSFGKFTTGQEDDYTTGCSLDYNFFKKYGLI